jgi:hypothetical protein
MDSRFDPLNGKASVGPGKLPVGLLSMAAWPITPVVYATVPTVVLGLAPALVLGFPSKLIKTSGCGATLILVLTEVF